MREFPVMMAKHFAASVSVQRKHSRTTAKLSAPALTKDMVGCCAPDGYQSMLRSIRDSKVNCVYVSRMRQISGKEQHLFRFFQQVMQHGIKVVTLEYSLRDRLHEYRLGMKIENYAARHKLPLPW